MKVTYALEYNWTKPVDKDPLNEFSKKSRARLRSTLNKIEESSVSHKIEPLTEETLSWFTPLYNETISNRGNPKIFDIFSTTLGKGSKYTYYSLILFEEEKPVGATIFSERKSVLSVAYRISPHDWENNSLPSTPSHYVEYLLNEYAWKRGYKKLSHGKDRHPYGINSQIGLAIFKLSIGCRAYTSTTEYNTAEIDLDSITEDQLIFEHPRDGREVTKGYLCIQSDHLNKYLQATKYPDQIEVEIITRD